MRTVTRITLLFGLFIVAASSATELKDRISERSERVIVEEATTAELEQARARTRSDYGMEMRPRVTEDDVGVALRIYLPDRWNKAKLKEQLTLVAESEQLRVAALEWQELIQVYRKFCDYRMFGKQLGLLKKELQYLEPYLEKANQEVAKKQLTTTDRAKLYSFYLDLVNDHAKLEAELLDVEQELRLLLGVDAELDQLAEAAHVDMPPKTEFEIMLQRALDQRADYRQFDLQARTLDAAEAVAESEGGFHLKYIQPDYRVDYNTGANSVGLSASFVLPWGTRSPDIVLHQQQRALTYASMNLQRLVIEHRLKVLLKSADEYYQQATRRSETLKPLLIQLHADLQNMNTARLEDLRDQMLIRERILEVSLQTTRAINRKEQIAVDLAAELGSLSQ